MTLATMADRTLPLAERVKEAVRSGMNAQAGDERFLPVLDALAELIADVAAADRLAPTGHGVWRILCGGCRAVMRVTGRLGTLNCPSCQQPIISTEATDA